MDAMTAPEFKDYVVRIFKRTDKNSELYEAITDTVIDMRMRFPFDDFRHEAYTGSIDTAGQYRLALPTDFGHIIGDVRVINGNDSWGLVKRTKEQYDRLYHNQNATNVDKGDPKHYCIYGTEILLGPVPDDLTYEYEINYSEEEFDEYEGTDIVTTIPYSNKYREMIRFGVLMRLYTGMDLDNDAIKWKALYEESIQKVIDNDMGNIDAAAAVIYRGI